MISTAWLIALLAISGVLAIVAATKWSQYYTLQSVKDWMSKMDRKTWIVEELDNDGPIDYAIGNLIARKRMEKLALSDSVNECRIVVVFTANEKQYKCSGVFSNGNTTYLKPKGEWFAWIAKEAVKQNGFSNAKIITHLVMSPEA